MLITRQATVALKETLSGLADFGYVNGNHVRLTVGAVKVCTGEMRYFDNRDTPIGVDSLIFAVNSCT